MPNPDKKQFKNHSTKTMQNKIAQSSILGSICARLLVPFSDIFVNMSFMHKTHPVYTRTRILRIQALEIHKFWDPFSAPFSIMFSDPSRPSFGDESGAQMDAKRVQHALKNNLKTHLKIDAFLDKISHSTKTLRIAPKVPFGKGTC